MHDIRNGKLEILSISRAEFLRFDQRHLICRNRPCDSFAIHLAGACDYHFQDGVTYRVQKGSLLYLPLHINYTMDVLTSDFTFIVVDFQTKTDEPRQYFLYTVKNLEIYEKLFQGLRQVFRFTSPDSLPDSMSLLFQIYAQIVRDAHPNYVNSASRKTVESLIAHIHANIRDPNLSVQRLIHKSDLSETHLRRIFQQICGMPPSKYIIHCRISHAKSLMGMQELTLQDISAQSGFTSYTYFCTSFKAVTGLKPSVFRQKFYP